MATTTPNYGWSVPTSTDLVKDGATAIETLGDSIDASFVGLKGGTTGQVLSKTSGTDLAFTWVAQDDSNAIQNAIVDAKGDLIGATAADTPTRLAVGTNGQVLTADSAEATGLKWATPAVSASALTLISSQSFSAVTSTTINNCFSATYVNYMIYVNINSATSSDLNYIKLRVSGTDSSASYNWVRVVAYDSTVAAATVDSSTLGYLIGTNAADSGGATRIDVYNPALARATYFASKGNRKNGSSLEYESSVGNHDVATAYDGLTLITSGSAFAGNIRVYGVQNA